MDNCLAKDVDKRLANIEGHIKGIRQMVLENKECEQILMQISAVKNALEKVGKYVLKNHLEHCVKEGVASGDISVLDKFSIVLGKYI